MKKLLYWVSFVICSILFCFVPQISVYAVGDTWTDSQKYSYFQNNFDDINTRLNGVIINQNRLEQAFEDYLQEYRENYNVPSGTTISDWISDNINISYQNGSSGNSDIDISQTLRECMRDWVNAYIESNTGFFYAYSYGTSRFIDNFSDQTQFHAFLDFISENDDKLLVVGRNAYDSGILVFDDPCDFVFYNSQYGATFVELYQNWSLVESASVYNRYAYDSNQQKYVLNNTGYLINRVFMSESINGGRPTNSSVNVVVNLNPKKYQVYRTVASMRNGTEGIQDYYTVTDSYNSNISGSYNTTTNNISNTLTNNDVSNYINNYYVNNGSYPTPNQVNVYITNNIDNGGGSGGGSGGDNGGGSGNSNIWDFLGSIGDFLGHLIEGLGNVLSGILSVLTDVIDMFIGENGLPNVIGQLIQYFLPFLPDWVPTLIGFSVVLALILGVIKLIRG